MNRLQLATLLSWAGESGLQGRKRLQKVVFFLQQAGCQLDCDYTIHHFGPYSRDVADICDEMVASGLIEEKVNTESWGMQYSYKLTLEAQVFLKQVEDASLQPFKQLGTKLINDTIKRLELGSTILFFGQTSDWDRALETACKFKKVSPSDDASQDALKLAKWVKEQTGNLQPRGDRAGQSFSRSAI